MRTMRGLQITSIVVLSPVLLLLISLISMLFISIFTQIVSTPTDNLIIQQQHQRSFNNKQVKRFRLFTKSKQSSMSWCIIIILYALYILLKKQKRQVKEPLMIEPIPKANKKHAKRRKVLKKEKKKRNTIDHVNTTIVTPKVNTQQPYCFPSPTPSCTTPKFDNNKIDLNLISPESTPIHSEDEEEEMPTHNWYSPFITGLDLDIIPKLTQDPIYNSPIFTTNHFKTTIPTHQLQLQQQQQQSRIKLLEIHPFIPSPSIIHHTHHAFGSIGDKRKNKH